MSPDTKQRILEAAEQVFAEEGWSGARTRQIAAEAEVHVAQLHYHFGSKEDLYIAVLANGIDRVVGHLRARLEETPIDSPDTLQQLVRAHFDLLGSRRHMVRLMMDAVLRRDARASRVAEDRLRPWLEGELLPRVLPVLAQGGLRAVDPIHALLSEIGLVTVYFVAQPLVDALIGPDAYGPEQLARRREALVDLLFHGIATPKEET